MGESTAATTQLIRSIRKLNDTECEPWQGTLRAAGILIHPKLSEILDCQLHPKPLYRARRGRGKSPNMGVADSRSALADTMEGEELTLRGG